MDKCKTCGAIGPETPCAYPTEMVQQLQAENSRINTALLRQRQQLEDYADTNIQDRQEVVRLKEELATWKQTAEAHKENFDILAGDLRMKLAAAQVMIEQMREALGNLLCRAETEYQALTDGEHGNFFEFPEAKFATATYHTTNLDALHEARALECERLKGIVADETFVFSAEEWRIRCEVAERIAEEAAQHWAKKEEGK